MPEGRITDQSLANRRGFLLGMTLAEVMLIVLFALLLLLGKHSFNFNDFKKTKEDLKRLESLQEASWTQDISQQEIHSLTALVEETKKRKFPNEEISDTWKRLTDSLKPIPEKSEEGKSKRELREVLEKKEESNQKLREALEAEKNITEKLRNEISILEIKPGSTPPCLHEPSSTSIRGKSISLGIIHIENNQFTLIQTTNRIPKLSPVDYEGKPFDYKEAYKLIMSWPKNQPITVERFKSLASEFVRIGNDESNGKLKCRFTMDYYMENVTDYRMLTNIFETYFFKQHELKANEFKKLRRN